MKKILSAFLAAVLAIGSIALSACDSKSTGSGAPEELKATEGLFSHAVLNSEDDQAWQLWQSVHDEDFVENEPNVKYFFLPASADEKKVDIYNAFSQAVSVNGKEIGAGKTETVDYAVDTDYTIEAGDKSFTLRFMKSNAEAAIYINNTDADGKGTDLMTYLNDEEENEDKSLVATATGAIVTPDGKIDNTPIEKIKGRGNTSWAKCKKSYNINYQDKVSIAGMKESRKYSLLANYQDDSLSRNRFLYDLSDAVGMPYASDSRYVDFYANGFYWGSYQICEKVSEGTSSLVDDISEPNYLNEDGSVRTDFPFLCEVDPGADYFNDYFVTTDMGIKLSIKYPELTSEETGYEEVKENVKKKFDEFYIATDSDKLSDYADIDSLAKLYLINELGKNWDSGVSSVFFVYKPDENGKYKFYGSPVWDYDNSLGNATGVEGELNGIGVDDYEEYTGWWCQYKGGYSNIINRLSTNEEVTEAAPKIWFDSFLPAINHFTGKEYSKEIDAELYTAEEYYDLIKDSAEMNYKSGWLLKTGDWIADHSSLNKAEYDSETKKMTVDKNATSYGDNFTDMYNYCCDWFTSRAAWLSQEFAK